MWKAVRRKPHAFLADWNAPIRVRPIQLQKELAMRQLLDFVNGKWHCAGIWLDALVDEGVDADTKSMIRIVLCLPWC